MRLLPTSPRMLVHGQVKAILWCEELDLTQSVIKGRELRLGNVKLNSMYFVGLKCKSFESRLHPIGTLQQDTSQESPVIFVFHSLAYFT